MPETTIDTKAVEQVAASDVAPDGDGPLRIAGSVDPSTGNVAAPGDVDVAGNVVDLHELKAGGNAVVGGLVEAASVTVAGNLTVRGGIAGKQQGRCLVGGSASARYVRQAHVEAAGDLSVETEITSARIISGNDVRAEGVIVGGQVTAAGSLACGSAGSPSGTRTVIELATDEWLRRVAAELIPQINRWRDKAAKSRQLAAPLMRNPKLLTPQQKEQATELLYEADEADAAVDEAMRRLTVLYSRSIARPPATLRVTGTLYAGVTVRFGGYETVITTPMVGPLGMRLKSSAGRHGIQVLLCEEESSLLLPAVPVQDPVMEQLRKEMAPRV